MKYISQITQFKNYIIGATKFKFQMFFIYILKHVYSIKYNLNLINNCPYYGSSINNIFLMNVLCKIVKINMINSYGIKSMLYPYK